jgi:putative ABC transport system permease protein
MGDLRHAFRRIVHNPLASGAALMVLALGIGANTVIFSAVSALLLRPFPFHDQERLVIIWERDAKTDQQLLEVSYPNFLDWRRENRSFEQIAAIPNVVSQGFIFQSADGPVRLDGSSVSANFFDVLGARPFIGRTFLPEEDQLGGPRAVVLGYSLWQRHFGGDPALVGKSITLGAEAVTVVGVMPPAFHFPAGAEVWAPIETAEPEASKMRGVMWLNVVGRLKPGVGIDEAREEMGMLARRLAATYEGTGEGRSAVVTPLADHILGQTRPALLVLLAAVALVLLIACVNVAGLLLVQGIAREREIALRLALGARRWRIAREHLAESLLLALLGGAAGLLLAPWGVEALTRLAPADVPRLDEIAVDARVLAFTAGVALLTAVLCGLVPALRAGRADINETLKEGARGATDRGGRRLRSLLLASQVALSVLVLVVAGLLARSFHRLQRVDLGFEPRQVLAVTVDVDAYDRLLERVRVLPGVEAAGAAMLRPLEFGARGFDTWVQFEGQPDGAHKTNPVLAYQVVTPDYFRTMGIRLHAGRDFDAHDTETAPAVVIVGATAARRFWPGQDPIGKRLATVGAKKDGAGKILLSTVVGVVSDVRQRGLESPTLDVYVPFTQTDSKTGGSVHSLFVRSSQEPMALLAAIRREVAQIDKGAPLVRPVRLETIVSGALAAARFRSLVLGGFAALALILAVVGIYGTAAYAVTQRTREIGVRMALGAQPGDMLRLVVRQGMIPVAAGLAGGLAAASALARLVASLLFGVSPGDPVTFLCTAILFGAVALAALALPARRAARIDPAVALRYE